MFSKKTFLLALVALFVAVQAAFTLPDAEVDGIAAVKSWAIQNIKDGEANYAATGLTRLPSPGFWGSEIVYQIQVDRFNNGDTSNDRKNLPDNQWANQDTNDLWGLPDYKHGGDLRGIINRLDYLQDLGVTVLWLTPIFKNDGGYHGYNQTDLTQVDPNFGTNEELRELVTKAHSRGIKIVLDVVANHMGGKDTYYSTAPDHTNGPSAADNKYWKGLTGDLYTPGRFHFGADFFGPLKNQAFFNRFGANSQSEMQGSGPAAVFGDFTSGMFDYDTMNWDFQEIYTNLHKYWVAYADVDGFRVDAAKHITGDFLEYFSTEIRDYAKALGKKNFYLIGEVAAASDWQGRVLGKMFSNPANPNDHGIVPQTITNRMWTLKDKYLAHGVFNFPGLNAVYDFAHGGTARDVLQNKVGTNSIEGYLNGSSFGTISSQSDARLFWNVLEIHDWPRFVKDTPSNPWKSRLGLSYLATAQGMPVIYYGMEQGFNGKGRTDNINAGAAYQDIVNTMNSGSDANARQDMFVSGMWRLGSTVTEINNLAYVGKSTPSVWADWKTDPFLSRTNDVYKTARKFNYLRQSSNALRYGWTFFRWGESNTSGLLAFSRIDNGQEVLVVVNNSNGPIAIPNLRVDNGINPTSGIKYVNCLNGTQVGYTYLSGGASYITFNGLAIDGNSVFVFAKDSTLAAWSDYLGVYQIKDNPKWPPFYDQTTTTWIGNTVSNPVNGSVTSTSDITITTETWPQSAVSTVDLNYSTDKGATWFTLGMNKNGTIGNNDKWQVVLGRFTQLTEVWYKVKATDTKNVTATDDNKGANYKLTVNADPVIKLTTLGTVAQSPANGAIAENAAITITAETAALNTAKAASLVYSTNAGSTWTTVAMTANGTTATTNKWTASIGGFAASTSVLYYLTATDNAGITLTANNGGSNYTATVNAKVLAPSVQWIGNVTQYPVSGSLNSTDDFWLNLESYPKATATSAWAEYSVDGGVTWTSAAMNPNGTVGNNDKWNRNLGKFAAGTTIQYRLSAKDGNGKILTALNGTAPFSTKVNGTSQVVTNAAPTFSTAAGAVSSGTVITLTSATAGTTVYFTTDGSTPTTASQSGAAGAATAQVTVTAAVTIKAYAVKAGNTDSAVATASYTILVPTAATPSFSTAAGAVTSGTVITLTSSTAGSTIYFTTDGSTPTTASQSGAAGAATASVTVTAAVTIKAIAVKAGYTTSAVASASYTIASTSTGTLTINFISGGNAENVTMPGDHNSWSLTANTISTTANKTTTITLPGAVTQAALNQGNKTTTLELKLCNTSAGWSGAWAFGGWTKGAGIAFSDANSQQLSIACTAGQNVTLTINVATATLSVSVQ